MEKNLDAVLTRIENDLCHEEWSRLFRQELESACLKRDLSAYLEAVMKRRRKQSHERTNIHERTFH